MNLPWAEQFDEFILQFYEVLLATTVYSYCATLAVGSKINTNGPAVKFMQMPQGENLLCSV